MSVYVETKRRSIAKAMSWRCFATFITASIAYFVTGKLAVALEVGVLDTVIKLAAYFMHERLWLRIPFGQRRYQDYQI